MTLGVLHISRIYMGLGIFTKISHFIMCMYCSLLSFPYPVSEKTLTHKQGKV